MPAQSQTLTGTLTAWDSVNYKANVSLRGSLKANLVNIPVARNIPSAEMVVGRKVAISFYDITNATDATIIGVFT